MGDVVREDVRFRSGSDDCAAWLFRPAESDGAALPCVVLGHGLGLVRGAGLAGYAEHFAQAGMVTLAFDYRYFGDSGGAPRGLLDIRRQREDWRAAVEYVRGLDMVDADRIALWGTSFGGGHVIAVAARDPRIAAVVAQCPFTDGLASGLRLGLRSAVKVGVLAVLDQAAALVGRPPVRIHAAGLPGSAALMTSAGTLPAYRSLFANDGPVDDRVTARVGLRILADRPGLRARSVRCPLLLCLCGEDALAPPGPSRRAAYRAPQGSLVEYPIGHFDIYNGDWRRLAIAEQTSFLLQHLTSRFREWDCPGLIK
jgi:uncharacterized protein